MGHFACNFISYTLHRATTIDVIVPSMSIPETGGPKPLSHRLDAKFPVLYLLHGGGNDYTTWERYTQIELFAEENSIAVVLMSAEDKRFTEGEYFDFVANEVPEYVCSRLPISDKPEDRFIAGLSMGGGAACYHFLKNPDRFGAVGILSSGIIRYNIGCEAMIAEHKANGKKLPPIYMACGNKDHNYLDIQQFRDLLIDAGADVTWVDVPDFNHEWRFWNLYIEQFLKWIPRSDFYAGKKRQC